MKTGLSAGCFGRRQTHSSVARFAGLNQIMLSDPSPEGLGYVQTSATRTDHCTARERMAFAVVDGWLASSESPAADWARDSTKGKSSAVPT